MIRGRPGVPSPGDDNAGTPLYMPFRKHRRARRRRVRVRSGPICADNPPKAQRHHTKTVISSADGDARWERSESAGRKARVRATCSLTLGASGWRWHGNGVAGALAMEDR